MEPDVAKAITSVVLFVITVVLGAIPWCIVRRGRGAPSALRDRVISLLTCFSGGVFLATCLLNLFVEGRGDLTEVLESAYNFSSYPAFELLVGAGFLMMALVEQLTMLCLSEMAASRSTKIGSYGRSQGRKSGIYAISTARGNGKVDAGGALTDPNVMPIVGEPGRNGVVGESGGQGDTTVTVEVVEEIHVPHSHQADIISNVSGVRAFLLLVALSFHTIFDGLAVGLQDKVEDVWSVFAAITVHKSVMAFCLGMELFTAFKRGFKRAMGGLLLFSLMSPIGIGLGIAITSPNVVDDVKNMISGVLQGLAAGSFLYVTCFEILQNEIGHGGSVIKVLVVILGFAAVAGIKVLEM